MRKYFILRSKTLLRQKIFPLTYAAVLASGCAHSMTATQPGYMASEEYQSRSSLRASLFSSDQASLSNEALERILTSKIQLHKGGRLAVVRLADPGDWSSRETRWNMAYSFCTYTDRRDVSGSPMNMLVEALSASKRFKDISVLPSMAIPSRPTISAIREMAARFQADTALIYKQYAVTQEIYRLFAADQGKAEVMVEAILLDVRTGAIPFCAVATQDFKVKKNSDDLDALETAARAKNQAAGIALTSLAGQLNQFLKAL